MILFVRASFMAFPIKKNKVIQLTRLEYFSIICYIKDIKFKVEWRWQHRELHLYWQRLTCFLLPRFRRDRNQWQNGFSHINSLNSSAYVFFCCTVLVCLACHHKFVFWSFFSSLLLYLPNPNYNKKNTNSHQTKHSAEVRWTVVLHSSLASTWRLSQRVFVWIQIPVTLLDTNREREWSRDKEKREGGGHREREKRKRELRAKEETEEEKKQKWAL